MEGCINGRCWYVSILHLTLLYLTCLASLLLILLLGAYLIVFITGWANLSPNILPAVPSGNLGYFDNAAYLGPATGGVINFVMLALLIFAFGTVSGAHFNPVSTHFLSLSRPDQA